MDYDSWKATDTTEATRRSETEPLEEDLEERDARDDHAQNVRSLLEVAQAEMSMTKEAFEAELLAWLFSATLDELVAARRHVDGAIAIKLGITGAKKPRKPRSDKGTRKSKPQEPQS